MRADHLFSYVTLSSQEGQLRFTNYPGPRKQRLKNLEGINFKSLPRPMTKENAALWLRGQPESADLNWRQAIERRLSTQNRRSNSRWTNIEQLLPEEVDTLAESLPEGAMKRVVVNAYERTSQARARCLEHFGTACTVCGVDFGVYYGKEADGYIHVHHLTPLASIKAEYEVDPLRDLRPVCPNCHAVIHLGGGVRSIESVREMIQRVEDEDLESSPTNA